MTTRTEALSTVTLSYSDISDLAGSAMFFQAPGNLPIEEWQTQSQLYSKWWTHFSGASLQLRNKKDVGDSYFLFPLRLNVYKKLVQIHAMLIWGAQPGNDIVRFYTESLSLEDEEEETQHVASRLLSMVILENGFYPALRQGARLFNTFGGVFIKVVPDDSLFLGVRLELLEPNFVFPVWGARGEIIELYVMYWIGSLQAAEYGYKESGADKVLYTEHWTRETWEITLGEEAKVAVYEGKELRGKNELRVDDESAGIIPFVYIPRLPTGSYYGESIVQDIIGLVQEINTLSADMGDAISESSHRKPWIRDYRGRGTLNLNDYERGEIINLGETPPGLKEPHIDSLDPPKYPESTLDYLEWIDSEIRQTTHTAAVILGLDEGSQRSSETLNARALPTVATINDYRDTWSDGFHDIAFLSMLCQKVLGKLAEDQPLTGWKLRADFHPVLPRDKQQLVTDESLLRGSGLRSLRQSLHQLGDVRNIDKEAKAIEEEEEREREFQTSLAQQQMNDRSNNGRPTSTSNSQPSNTPSSGNNAKGADNRAKRPKTGRT